MTASTQILAAGDLGLVAITLQCGLLLLLVVLSGTFSGSETVLFSLTPVQLERASTSTNPFRRLAAQLMRSPRDTLRSVLVANTAVNVLLFATSYVFFDRLASRFDAWWVTPLSAIASILLVVVGGEVVPKVLAVSLAERLAPVSATVVRTASIVADPIGRVIDWVLAEPFVRVLFGHRQREAGEAELSTVELKTLLQMSKRGGTIEPLEDTFLRAIIDLGHIRVRDVMTPRVEITAFDIGSDPEDLRELMRQTHYRKVPVHTGRLDDIIGLVYAKVLFLQPQKPLRKIVQPVHFVPELSSCERLLVHFRATRSQLAIAVDEYGGVAGLVTLEDVLEAIVGELHDPEDAVEQPDIVQVSDAEFDVSGSLSVHYWVELFRLPQRVERVATVGGLVMSRLGRPARPGDIVRIGNVQFKVTEVRRRRIERLELRLLDRPKSGKGAR